MEKKSLIKVTVTGQANVGKSAVIKIIRDALRQNGIEVELDKSVLLDHGGSETRFDYDISRFEKERVGAVRRKSTVTIDQVQTARKEYK